MIRVVLDKNILVAAALSISVPSSVLVNLVIDELARPCISQAVLDEYMDVLNREDIGIDPLHAMVGYNEGHRFP